MEKAWEEKRFSAILTPLLGRIFDYGVPKEIKINDENSICINGIPIGDCRLARNFELTDDFLLKYDYDGKKRFINFGTRGFEKINRVKAILELNTGLYPSKIVWEED